jgi:D-glycero-D-manno-heptose 1,7-bisphosphate phosphatase
MKRFLVFDRDGTLIDKEDYLADPEGVRLVPGSVAALHNARDRGWGMVIVTNQSGVARGLMSIADVEAVNERVCELFAAEGVTFEGVYYAPDDPANPSTDRKPGTGLVLRAAAEHGFDPAATVVVGDRDTDILLARNLGSVGVLVLTGDGRDQEIEADFVMESVADLPSVLQTLAETGIA